MCSSKSGNIHRKISVLESIKYQVFSCKYYEIFKNSFLKRTTPVAVSGNSKLLYKIVAQSHIAKNCRKSEPI